MVTGVLVVLQREAACQKASEDRQYLVSDRISLTPYSTVSDSIIFRINCVYMIYASRSTCFILLLFQR